MGYWGGEGGGGVRQYWPQYCHAAWETRRTMTSACHWWVLDLLCREQKLAIGVLYLQWDALQQCQTTDNVNQPAARAVSMMDDRGEVSALRRCGRRGDLAVVLSINLTDGDPFS